MKSLAKTINIEMKNGVLIYEDNTECIIIASNQASHRLEKQIDIK